LNYLPSLIFALAGTAFVGAQAAPITGVTATSAMGSGYGTSLSSMTDGSGLSSYTAGATHATGSTGNTWVSNNHITGSVLFDLGGIFDLSGMDVWNYNAGNSFGVQRLSVLGSLDGTNFSVIAGSPGLFAIGASNVPELAEHFNFLTTAAFVRFDIQSNYGGGALASALSEVMFDGAPLQIPEPTSLVLVLAALAASAGIRRATR